MGYLLSINTSHVDKLPKDTSPARWAGYNDAFRNVELTSAELARVIQAGHAIAPQCNGRRKASNFRLAQHIGVDLDDGTYNWDDLVTMPIVDGYAAIVHTTASYTPDNHRYRVIFLLEEPITNPSDYTHVVGLFMRAFGAAADPACKDPARLFFGAKDCSLLHMPENVVTADDLAAIMAKYPPGDQDLQVDPQKRELPRPATVATPTDSAIVPPSELSAARRDAHLDALLGKVRTAPDGAKWFTLRDVSYTLGGYARAGYFTFPELQKELRAAIETRRATVASMPAAYSTIDDALEAGAAYPLYYERTERGNTTNVGTVSPPTDARGRLRWILERRRAELEQAIAAADLETCPDFEAMTHEYTLVMERLEATA